MPKKCKLSRNDMLMVLKIFRYTKCMRAQHHFRGSICIEKWSQNFDSGTQSAIFDTPKIAKNSPNDPFCGGLPYMA